MQENTAGQPWMEHLLELGGWRFALQTGSGPGESPWVNRKWHKRVVFHVCMGRCPSIIHEGPCDKAMYGCARCEGAKFS